MNYQVLAYYIFTPIADPLTEVAKHQAFIREKEIRCRVYISEQGINGQMSASTEDAQLYREWLRSDCRFQDISFKIHTYSEHVFPRATVKYRKQLVALDEDVDMALSGERLTPEQWKGFLEERDEKTLLLDVRNDYEWEVGHFEGAELPTLETFREFPLYARALKEKWDPKETRVMMYCTGGIRCELYSALLKKEGFERVYQLDGGVIQYGLEEGDQHWKGKLFVFDDRLAIPLGDEKEGGVISKCKHCDAPSDVYYNCSNTDCNDLFLSCASCAEIYAGCCSSVCTDAPRRRPFEKGERPKPFRRAHHYCCDAKL